MKQRRLQTDPSLTILSSVSFLVALISLLLLFPLGIGFSFAFLNKAVTAGRLLPFLVTLVTFLATASIHIYLERLRYNK